AQFGRQVGSPELLSLDLLLEGVDGAVEDRLVLGLEDLQRVDLVLHEGPHPLQFLFELGFGFEVPGHLKNSLCRSTSRCRRQSCPRSSAPWIQTRTWRQAGGPCGAA